MIVPLLVLHHRYTKPVAFDLSQHKNHGALEGVGSVGGALVFGGGSDRVRVRSSSSLSDLRSVRAQVSFTWKPTAGGRRHNLIEGYLSFAMFVNPDGSLQGTILDRTGHWRGVTTPPGVIQPNQWHVATFEHDGLSAARMYVDGALVAADFGAIGPVRGVGAPHGIAIGHWPDPGDQYTLEGHVSEVKVWKNDPRAAEGFVDQCCIDRAGLDEIIEGASDAGMTNADLRHSVGDLLDVGYRVAGQLASPTQADHDLARSLSRDAGVAFLAKDMGTIAQLLATTSQMVTAKLPPAQVQADYHSVLTALDQTPFGGLFRDAIAEAQSPAGAGGAGGKPGADKVGAIIEQLGSVLCLGWLQPPRRPDRDDDHRHPGHGDHGSDDHDDHGRPADDIPDDRGGDSGSRDDPPYPDPDKPPAGTKSERWPRPEGEGDR